MSPAAFSRSYMRPSQKQKAARAKTNGIARTFGSQSGTAPLLGEGFNPLGQMVQGVGRFLVSRMAGGKGLGLLHGRVSGFGLGADHLKNPGEGIVATVSHGFPRWRFRAMVADTGR